MVIKRNGNEVPFEIDKIVQAITNASNSLPLEQGIGTDDIVEIAQNIYRYYIVNGKKLTVEKIQDLVEQELMNCKAFEVAKEYILYRQQHANNRAATDTLLNYKDVVDSYLKVDDWRVKENATVTYSVGGLILSNSGAMTANYWLSEVYDKDIADAHRNADIHIHDLSMLTGYCAGWSLKQLIEEGLGGVPGKITSTPANHLSTLCNQMVNFLGIMQNEWAGAQAFSSFDTYLAPFVKVDNLTQKEVKQCIQSFVYGVNTPSRWGTQAPFSNITLDWTVPNDLKNLPAIIGGKEMDFIYGDCQKEMDMVNKAFIEVMIEGDANGRGFQYPIPTYSITPDFDWSETENNKLLFEMTAKYGTPYFSNYVNSDMEPSDVRSMCPLTGDTKILIRSSKGISNQEIEQLYKNQAARDTVYEVWTPVGWREIKFNKQNPTDIYKFTLSNGAEVKMGANHLQPTMDGVTIKAQDLKVGDWLPFNKQIITGYDIGSYGLGFAIGAYAGDGSHDDKAIVYSLDAGEKDNLTEQKIREFWTSIGYNVVTTFSKRNVRFVRVNGNPYSIICEYLDGTDALTKSFKHKVFNMSEEFRQGMLEGYIATDGARDRKRLYTSSPYMRKDLCMLLSSLGKKYRVDYPGRDNYGNLYKADQNFHYYRIEKIEKLEPQTLYCGEVDNDDRLFMLSNGLITHNCRLRLDLRELRKKSGGFFGSGESTGSVGVVTINLPRIAYQAKDEKDFYRRLDRLMDIAARSLKIKRNVITKWLDDGLYPYTKRYLGTFDNHFSTIGLIGMNEAGLNANWLKADLTDIKVQEFAKEVLNHMRERLSDYQEKYGDLYNLEATPAESTTYRFAKHDKEDFPDIITANMNGTPYYTNSSHLPVGYTEDVFSALDIQDELQTLYTSGTVFHAFLGEKLPDWKAAANLVRKIAENYKLPYYTMSPTYSVCKAHGYLTGEQYTCPICGEKTEVNSRITGYYRPVQNWNDGKAQEFKDRKVYNIGRSHLTHVGPKTEETCEACQIQPQTNGEDKVLLFKTKTCPNCKVAGILLDKAEIEYQPIDAEENPDIVEKYHIMQAPTLVVINNEKTSKYKGVSDIRGWINEQSE